MKWPVILRVALPPVAAALLGVAASALALGAEDRQCADQLLGALMRAVGL